MVCWLGILLRAALLWSCLWGRRLETFREVWSNGGVPEKNPLACLKDSQDAISAR